MCSSDLWLVRSRGWSVCVRDLAGGGRDGVEQTAPGRTRARVPWFGSIYLLSGIGRTDGAEQMAPGLEVAFNK